MILEKGSLCINKNFGVIFEYSLQLATVDTLPYYYIVAQQEMQWLEKALDMSQAIFNSIAKSSF